MAAWYADAACAHSRVSVCSSNSHCLNLQVSELPIDQQRFYIVTPTRVYHFECSALDPEESRRWVEELSKACTRLDTIPDKLLSRIKAGATEGRCCVM